MRVESLQYELPADLIAQHPSARRDEARLLVVRDEIFEHATVGDLDDLLPAGALLVVNDTRVVPARLLGRKVGTGGRVEVLLVERRGVEQVALEGRTVEAERWTAMARASRALRPGVDLELGAALRGQVLRRVEEGLLEIQLHAADGQPVAELLESAGHVPLPPYVRRADEPSDRERYQTVFARCPGAVAAPTAGLHFTTELLERLERRGVSTAAVTLHVGPGTFRPVTVADLDHHPMHAERFVVSPEVVAAVEACRADGRPVVAVGTTVVRALETAADAVRPGAVKAMQGVTRLLIQPGYRFKVVDGLLTNFHLPGSTLLALVYAFAGAHRVRQAYAEALRQRYRFYSYGDAMYLPRRLAETRS